jgi:hypothetical protein
MARVHRCGARTEAARRVPEKEFCSLAQRVRGPHGSGGVVKGGRDDALLLKRSDTPQDAIDVWRRCQLWVLRAKRAGVPDSVLGLKWLNRFSLSAVKV